MIPPTRRVRREPFITPTGFRIVLIALALSLAGSGCGASTTPSNATPDEQAIRDYDATFEVAQQSIDDAIQTSVASPAASASPDANSDIGYQDFNYGATDLTRPTGSKTNHPVWHNDGIWWASLFSPQADSYHIHRLDIETQVWSDTGTVIDSRNSSTADVIASESSLLVVSVGDAPRSSADGVYFARYGYDPANKTYQAEAGFPVTLTDYGLRSLSLAEDASGGLWLSYVHDSMVWVTSSTDGGETWDEPATLDVAGTQVSDEDVAVAFAYDDRVGIAWSNQIDDAFYFTSHGTADPFGRWSVTHILVQDEGIADNHLSVTTLANDPAGKVFIAAKTSKDAVDEPQPDSPQILLFVLGQDDLWRSAVVSRVRDDQTRPAIAIDTDDRRVLIFATAPLYGGAIYVKSSGLDELRFPAGLGATVMRTSRDSRVNNAAVSRQLVTGASGLLVIASDMDTRTYLHNYFPGDQLSALGR